MRNFPENFTARAIYTKKVSQIKFDFFLKFMYNIYMKSKEKEITFRRCKSSLLPKSLRSNEVTRLITVPLPKYLG